MKAVSTFKTELESSLIEKVENVIVSLNYKLRDLDYVTSSPGILRITIEASQAGQGIGVDDCAEVHRVLGPMFDVWDPVSEAYNLEISSPGEKAPLRLLEHFKEAVGDEIDFKTVERIIPEGQTTARKKWRGVLTEVFEDTHEIQIKDYMGTHTLALSQVMKAKWLRT